MIRPDMALFPEKEPRGTSVPRGSFYRSRIEWPARSRSTSGSVAALAAVAHFIFFAAPAGAGVIASHLGDGPDNRASLGLAAG